MNLAKTNKYPEKVVKKTLRRWPISQATVRRRGNCFHNGFDMRYRKFGYISIDNHFLFFIVLLLLLFSTSYLLLKTLIFISVLAIELDLRLDMH